jgi:hypothetical protein
MTTYRMNLLSFRSISPDRTFVVDIEYQSVSPFVGIGSPHPRKRVCLPPPLDLKEGSNTPSGARGWLGGGPSSDDWKESLALCILFGVHSGSAVAESGARIM